MIPQRNGNMKNTRLVYSTETGRICPQCRKAVSKCTCKKKGAKTKSPFKPDGIVRIRREIKGRKGKTVTTIFGFDLDDAGLKNLGKQLKQNCGSGGTVKDGMIIIQGDHRKSIEDFLKKAGYTVKIAGG